MSGVAPLTKYEIVRNAFFIKSYSLILQNYFEIAVIFYLFNHLHHVYGKEWETRRKPQSANKRSKAYFTNKCSKAQVLPSWQTAFNVCFSLQSGGVELAISTDLTIQERHVIPIVNTIVNFSQIKVQVLTGAHASISTKEASWFQTKCTADLALHRFVFQLIS